MLLPVDDRVTAFDDGVGILDDVFQACDDKAGGGDDGDKGL